MADKVLEIGIWAMIIPRVVDIGRKVSGCNSARDLHQ